jgi:hypothetical protein
LGMGCADPEQVRESDTSSTQIPKDSKMWEGLQIW